MKGYFIGIDLGTTNSVVAYAEDKTKVITGPDGKTIMKSAVAFLKGEYICGNAAVDQIYDKQMDLVLSIKRIMGLKRDNKILEKYILKSSMYAFNTPDIDADKDIEINLGGHKKTPVQITAMILSRIRENAEKALDAPILGSVVTVPAYFTPSQKKATWAAANEAGLTVMRLLDEPSAAAIAYGIHHFEPGESRVIAVFDMGGGTFDISIISVVMDKFTTLALGGDSWLGGDDFDEVILDYIANYIKKNIQIDIWDKSTFNDSIEHRRWIAELKQRCECAKRKLTTQDHYTINVLDLPDANGGIIDIEVKITKDDFEKSSEELINRAMAALSNTMNEAGISDYDLDHILLVGGSTYIPAIRKTIEKRFGKQKVLPTEECQIDPMHCVAIGASLLANSLGGELFCPVCNCSYSAGDERCAECGYSLTRLPEDVRTPTSHYYAVELQNDEYNTMISKGEMLPTDPVKKEFFTNRHNQRRLRVPIYASEQNVFIKNRVQKQGDAFAILPEGLPAGTSVWISIWLSEEEIFDLSIEVDGVGAIEPRITYSSKAVLFDEYMKQGEREIEELVKQGRAEEAEELNNIRENANELFDSGDEEAALNVSKEFAQKSKEASVLLVQERKRTLRLLSFSEFIISQLRSHFSEDRYREIKNAVEDTIQKKGKNSSSVLKQANDHLDSLLENISRDPAICNLLEVYNMVELAARRDPSSGSKLRSMWQSAKLMEGDQLTNELDRIRGEARIIIEKYGGLESIPDSTSQSTDNTLGIETDDRLRGNR